MRIAFAAWLLLAGVPALWAQDVGVEVEIPAQPVDVSPVPDQKPPRAPEARPVTNGPLMDLLVKTMTNKPVVVVSPIDQSFTSPKDEDLEAEATLLGKLQVVAATCSPRDPLIPFRIRDSWTIAPERIKVIDLEGPLGSADQVMGRNVCLERFMAEADVATAKRLGADEGVAVRDLPAAMQSALRAGLRPPMRIQEWQSRPADSDVTGIVHDRKEVQSIEEPLDWSQARVRARLSVGGVEVPVGSHDGESSAIVGSQARREGRRFTFDNGWRNVEVPGLATQPNRFKPSDLDGRRLTRAIGISGVVPAKQALDQIAKVNGLKLYSGPLPNIWVFIGHRDIASGDVLDAMRLGLESAFRSMADGFVLTWDVRGAGALQQLAQERAASLVKEASKAQRDTYRKTGLLALAENLAFAKDDPLALTDDQRDRILGIGAGDEGPDKGLGFADLTASQQAYIRKITQGEAIWTGNDGDGPGQSRPLQPGDLANARISSQLSVQVEVSLPSLGWVRVDNDGWGYLYPGRLESLRRRDSGQDPDEEDIPPELLNPQPVSIPAAETGLFVPVLGPSRLVTLSDEMKRHGANVLFYPALFEGYATFPTPTFPLHPSLREVDGLAAAAREMKRNGIRMVPYVSVLAWQGADQKSHWLNRHPDWVDREVAGRTALQFWEANGRPGWSPFGNGAPPSNYVRPNVAEVATRLKTFLGELLKKPNVDAVFLTDWFGDDAGGAMESPVMLSLGFAMPERVAAVKTTGIDPVDARLGVSASEIPVSAERLVRRDERGRPQETVRATALVGDLVATIRSAKPAVRIYLQKAPFSMMRGPDVAAKLPKVDVTMAGIISAGPDAAGGGLILPVWSRDNPPAIFDEAPPKMRDVLIKQSSLALFGTVLRLEGAPGGMGLKCVAFDFRQAPEEITDSLQWLKPPGSTPPKVAPASPTTSPPSGTSAPQG